MAVQVEGMPPWQPVRVFCNNCHVALVALLPSDLKEEMMLAVRSGSRTQQKEIFVECPICKHKNLLEEKDYPYLRYHMSRATK